ncbi:MAG: glycosyltransferase [Lachnospiraceae bacterium]|nr:glycosyltransferase [Lachnospiraceae bacterium]
MCGGGITFNVTYFAENKGHGNARRAGLEICKNKLVALMDADDVCVNDRFEQQLKFHAENEADIVGGNIAEFIDTINNVVAYRTVPTSDIDIKTYMKKRCPFNQMTVMLKKDSVKKAGGYIDWYCDEDYYLWIRMAQNNCVMMNTGTVLVKARVGKDMYNRRGGKNYFKSELELQKYMFDNEIIRFNTYIMNVTKRFIVQILMPNKVRSWAFRKFARKKMQ